ncbi:MAG: PD-(D/E)XK nuclease family protein [Chthoniobacterales bacterium]|nr:PD-(D/E)XK nuclease family protein [Chthoniobacterales bacterium]
MSFLDELRVQHETAHSRLLAWLLKPDGDHGLGTAVLRKFWALANAQTVDPGLGRASVRVEERQDSTRADIAIETAETYLLVENKTLWSAFSESQLTRHVSSGKRRAERVGKKFKLVLLLPDDNAPKRARDEIAALRRDCKTNVITWAQVVGVFKDVARVGKTPAIAPGRPFLEAYAEFIEREVLHQWKGFNMNTLNNETVAAAARPAGGCLTSKGRFVQVSAWRAVFGDRRRSTNG